MTDADVTTRLDGLEQRVAALEARGRKRCRCARSPEDEAAALERLFSPEVQDELRRLAEQDDDEQNGNA